MADQSITPFGTRESIDYDGVIVGAGPGGLATAIHLKQQQPDLSVCVLEKGAEVGAHILSGAVMDPRALNELFPDWQAMGAPLHTPVSEDRFLFLTQKNAFRVPNWLLPDCFQNHGNYIVSLANVARWLGEQAQALGVDIFPGFAATEVLYNEQGAVMGVATGNMGIGKNEQPTAHFQLGMALHAKYTVFAEGSRGHLGQQLLAKYRLNQHSDPQSYGLGIKELWEVSPTQHHLGLVMHSAGWPLSTDTYGGGFLYHLADNQVAVGLVVGLAYKNPYLSPYEEFQRYKTHPAIRCFLEGGKRISYGARAITAGGVTSLPKLIFPGGALIGCEAGLLNAARIKGSHAAIKSGMLVAQSIVSALLAERANDLLCTYPQALQQSWLFDELYRARNFKQWMSKGLWLGTTMVGIEQKIMGGKIPWTLHHRQADHQCMKPAAESTPIVYPKPDGKLTFDRLSSVFISNTNHEENQPSHLTLKDATIPTRVNLALYAGPEQRYCPAGVYEFIKDENHIDQLHINAQNCVHCKTCDIKDPTQNIVWVAPEGGGGPRYPGM
ncbi:MAG: electron transfer flavoprotein-ubiquinone oxidoreductase [Ottowia sp.]|nr:electron transfer flavoprotein-ubiquinone oxidoreductase [Ottowia sp.]